MDAPNGLRERKKRESADRIVEAARETLREGGLEAMTVERIAERANVSPPTVFNLVGRREQIWEAIVDRGLRALEMDSLVDLEHPRESARRLITCIVDLFGSDEAVFKPLLRTWGRAARHLQQDPSNLLESCFRAAGAADPRRCSELAQAGLVGLLYQWSLGNLDAAGTRERCEDVVNMIFDYFVDATSGHARSSRKAR